MLPGSVGDVQELKVSGVNEPEENTSLLLNGAGVKLVEQGIIL